jgi:hypothetical protein
VNFAADDAMNAAAVAVDDADEALNAAVIADNDDSLNAKDADDAVDDAVTAADNDDNLNEDAESLKKFATFDSATADDFNSRAFIYNDSDCVIKNGEDVDNEDTLASGTDDDDALTGDNGSDDGDNCFDNKSDDTAPEAVLIDDDNDDDDDNPCILGSGTVEEDGTVVGLLGRELSEREAPFLCLLDGGLPNISGKGGSTASG